MRIYLQGLTMGLAYVAPIGLQNLFVINSALTQRRSRVYLTALIVILWDVSLGVSCFLGAGALMQALPWLQKVILGIGSLIVIWIGIGLLRSRASLEGGRDVNVPIWKLFTTAFVVTWINPQALIDGTMMLGAFRDVQRTFQRLHLFISPGGLLAFDVRLPERLAALDGQVFLDETEDTYCVWRTEYRRGLCTYYMDLFTLAEDGSWDRSFELHRQRGYSVEQLTRWLEEAGFADVRTWGDGKLRRPVPGEDRVYFTCIRK